MEELLTPMAGVQWCHLDLWADNVRGTPDGGVCVVDFDNAGPGDPTRELGMVLFEFARTARARVAALVTAYEATPAAPGRVTRAEDFGLTIAQLHHIGRHHVTGLAARPRPGGSRPRPRRRPGVRRRPFLLRDVERLLGWLES